MLNTLRKGAKSWVAKALIALLIASFAVWGIGDIFSFSTETAVATAGEEEVTAEEYADALRLQQSRLSQQAGRVVSIGDMRALGIDRRVLAGLLRDAAYRAELAELGIAAPDRAVAEAIRENPAFHGPSGEFADSAYRTMLAQQGFTPQRFERLTRTVIGQSLISTSVSGTAEPPPGAATRIAAYQGERRGVSLLRLVPAMAAEPAEPTEAELEAFLAGNEARFREPERRFGRYLVVDAAAVAAAAEPAEEEVRAAYENAIGRFRTEATAVIDQIPYPSLAEAEAAATRLASGEADFEALVADRGLAPGDVDLGRVTEAALPPGIAEAVFALDAPGIAGPVETPLGAAIVRVRELTPGATLPFEEVRDDLAAEVARAEALFRVPEIASEVEELRAGGAPFEEIAARVEGVRAGDIEGLARDGTLKGGGEAPGLLASAEARAEIAAALDQEERDMVELPDGSFLLVQIDRIEPAYLPPLAEIRDEVSAAWAAEERTKALEARAARIVAGLASGSGATLASTAAGLGRQPVEIEPFLRDGAPPAIPRTLMGSIFEAETGAFLTARDPADGSVLIVEVTEIVPLDPAILEAGTAEIEGLLSDSLGRDTIEYFARAMEAHHGASTMPGAIEQVFGLLGAAQAPAGM